MGDRDWSGFTGVECVFREDANLRRRLPPKRKPAPAPPPVVQLAPEPTLPAEEPVPAVELAPEPTAVAEQPAAAAPVEVSAADPPPPEPAEPAQAPRRKNGLRWWTDPDG